MAWVQTPLLIVHGADDPYMPVGQAYELDRALRELGRPVELAVYPREGHRLPERAHQLDLAKRLVAWFARWLVGAAG